MLCWFGSSLLTKRAQDFIEGVAKMKTTLIRLTSYNCLFTTKYDKQYVFMLFVTDYDGFSIFPVLNKRIDIRIRKDCFAVHTNISEQLKNIGVTLRSQSPRLTKTPSNSCCESWFFSTPISQVVANQGVRLWKCGRGLLLGFIYTGDGPEAYLTPTQL